MRPAPLCARRQAAVPSPQRFVGLSPIRVTLHPPLQATMGLLTLRANEVSVRKEVYFLLLRYKLVLDW